MDTSPGAPQRALAEYDHIRAMTPLTSTGTFASEITPPHGSRPAPTAYGSAAFDPDHDDYYRYALVHQGRIVGVFDNATDMMRNDVELRLFGGIDAEDFDHTACSWTW